MFQAAEQERRVQWAVEGRGWWELSCQREWKRSHVEFVFVTVVFRYFEVHGVPVIHDYKVLTILRCLYNYRSQCTAILNLSPLCSVADPDPHGSKFILVGWIRIQEGKKWLKKWKKFKFWSAAWYLLWQCCESGSVCFWASRIQIH